MPEGYCLLTGDTCSRSITEEPYTFFISEPYDRHRIEREKSIKEAIKGYKYVISDRGKENISISCKICRQIQSCFFGIVDITSLNRNVLIELGMLYGFRKPTIILVKPRMLNFLRNAKYEIPSNIIGIEQIRYKDFTDLQTQLKEALTTLFEIARKQADYVLDLKPLLALKVEQLELAVSAKKAINSGLQGRVRFYRFIDQVPSFILNKGKKDGLRNNMVLTVYNLTLFNGNTLEEEVGRLIIKNAQEKISQCYLWFVEPNGQQFWNDLIVNSRSLTNVVRPFVAEELGKLSEEELAEYTSKLKILLSGFSINVN